ELCDLIYKCQNKNKEAITLAINKFMPLVKKYAYFLGYQDAQQDIIVLFLEIINKIPIQKFDQNRKNELTLSYISKSMKNGYITLSKKKRLKDLYIEDVIPENLAVADKVELGLIRDALKQLTSLQRRVIYLKYHYGYKDSEISSILHTSRQAVNQTKLRALKTLKSIIKQKDLQQ
ncbi:MAG: sigma-70 family RNA polymerase sigma factor, partial [Ethanoligenens sp.]